jgi:hypothetical protein
MIRSQFNAVVTKNIIVEAFFYASLMIGSIKIFFYFLCELFTSKKNNYAKYNNNFKLFLGINLFFLFLSFIIFVNIIDICVDIFDEIHKKYFGRNNFLFILLVSYIIYLNTIDIYYFIKKNNILALFANTFLKFIHFVLIPLN